MDNLFSKLKKMPEYKAYKRKSRIRALAALVIVSIFGVIVFATSDLNNLDEVSFMYLAIAFIGAAFSIKALFTSFFKKPIIIYEGTISDIKEMHRTVQEEDRLGLQTRVNYLYLVSDDTNEYWGQYVAEYNNGYEKKHVLGERVLFFAYTPSNGYIIKL